MKLTRRAFTQTVLGAIGVVASGLRVPASGGSPVEPVRAVPVSEDVWDSVSISASHGPDEYLGADGRWHERLDDEGVCDVEEAEGREGEGVLGAS